MTIHGAILLVEDNEDDVFLMKRALKVGVESKLDKGSRFWLILSQGKYDEDESRVTAD